MLGIISKIFRIIFLPVLIISFLTAKGTIVIADEPPTPPFMKKINTDVQLKDNGMIKIIYDFLYEKTPEELCKHSPEPQKCVEFRKDIGKTLGKSENERYVYVAIQFLKKCAATTKIDEYFEKNYQGMDPNKIILLSEMVNRMKLTREGRFILEYMEMNALYNEGKKKEAIEKGAKLMDYPDYWEYVTPKFRSDYHTKVFITFFTDVGMEVKTENNFPIAYYIDKDSELRKTEMLPGEQTYLEFMVPNNSTYWYVWVPK